jgi:hypothetical protein
MDWELALGPLLALIPILVWELGIKPWKVRQHVAQLLLAEFRINLREIGGVMAMRADTPGTVPVNITFSRVAFDALAADVGELEASTAHRVVRFYSGLARIEGIAASASEYRVKALETQEQAYADACSDALDILDRSLERVLDRGLLARDALYAISLSDWSSAPPKPPGKAEILERARQRYAHRLTPGTDTAGDDVY